MLVSVMFLAFCNKRSKVLQVQPMSLTLSSLMRDLICVLVPEVQLFPLPSTLQCQCPVQKESGISKLKSKAKIHF